MDGYKKPGDGTAKGIATQALELEIETRRAVSKTISRIEVALADWDALKRRPRRLSGRMEYLRKTHRTLSKWTKESLKGRKDLESVSQRLRAFRDICEELGEGPG